MSKQYNPVIHYNHCTMCGEPILDEEERNAHVGQDGDRYHHACVPEGMPTYEQVQEEWMLEAGNDVDMNHIRHGYEHHHKPRELPFND